MSNHDVIRAAYAAGETQKALAQRYGCSQATISGIVRGIERQPAWHQEAAALYNSGLSLQETGDRLGYTKQAIQAILDRLGIARRPRGGPNFKGKKQ